MLLFKKKNDCGFKIIEYVFQALDVLSGSDHLGNSSFIVFILILILSTVNIVFLNISFVMLCNCVCQDSNIEIFIKNTK